MANFNYRRFFIILRVKDTGFELQGKEPSGYCKIDIKNNRIKFFIYVQDLKPQAIEQGIYEAYIVSPRDEKPAQKLTDIFVDNRGRSECSVESDTQTLNRTTKSLEELSVIAIVYKNLLHTDKLLYPLVGSAGKRTEIDWSGRIMADILKTSKTESYEQQIPSKAEIQSNVTPEKANDIELTSEISNIENPPIEDSSCANLASEEIIVEKIETHDKIDFKVDENPYDKTGEPECPLFSSTNYWDVMRDYFMKISKENPIVYPFGNNDERRWVKVEHIPEGYSKYSNQRAYMDIHTCDYQRQDTESLTHYLVGFIGQDEDVSFVIYAFPGYSFEQPPAYAIHGLSVWEPLKNGYGKGYWLIYIDAQTGDLVRRP